MSQSTAPDSRRNYKKARHGYKKALAASPNNVDLLMEFAVFEAQSEQWSSARRLLTKAKQLTPRDAAVHLNLGEVCRSAGDLEAAADHYRDALSIDPDDVDALYGLGDALRAIDKCEEALAYLDRAHALAPADTEILNALAITLESEGQAGRAMQCYHRAISLSPDFVDAWCNYAQLLFQERRFSESAQAFEGAQMRMRTPLPTLLLLKWANALAYDDQYERAFEIVEQAIAAGDEPADARFTMGTIYMQYGDFDTAAEHFHATLEIDANAGEAYEKLARIKRLDAAAAERLETVLNNDDLPVSPRAGAGFALYSVLDKAGRYDEAFQALMTANALKAATLKFSPAEHERMISASIEVFDKDFFSRHSGEGLDTEAPIFILGMPRSGTTLCEQILAAYDTVNPCGEQQDFQHLVATLPDYPAHLEELGDGWARMQGERILNLMLDGAPEARFATNKSPGNYAFIGLIAWLFPQCRIIYCKRDPRDIGLSSLEQNFRAGLSFTYDQEAFGFAYRQHARIMAHWQQVAPVEILEVEYERLVGEPDTTARGMVEFCRLQWQPECLDTARVTRPIETASVWQVRQPINKGSVGKWRRYEHHLKPMIDALGME